MNNLDLFNHKKYEFDLAIKPKKFKGPLIVPSCNYCYQTAGLSLTVQ